MFAIWKIKDHGSDFRRHGFNWFAKPGDIIGLGEIIVQGNGHVSVIAMEDSCGCFINAENFRKILAQCDQELCQNIIRQLVLKSRNTERLIGYMSSKKSVIKFCGLIKELILQFGLNNQNELAISLSIKEWAELANIQRETLQRMKKQLEYSRLLKWNKNKIQLLSIYKLDEILLKGKLNGKK